MRTTTLATSCALISAGLLMGLTASPKQHPIGHPGVQRSATTPTQLAAFPQALRLFAGQKLVYSVQMNSDASFDMRAAMRQQDPNADTSSAPSMTLRTALLGKLEMVAVATSLSRTQVLCTLHPETLHMNANGQEVTEPLASLRKELALPFLTELNRTGQITSVRFDPQCDTTAQGFVRTLLAYLQVSRPTGASATSWDVREADPNGIFLTRYSQQAATKGEIVLCKTRQAEATTNEAASPQGLRKVVTPSGGLRVTVDSVQGITREVEGEETFATVLGVAPVAQSHNTVGLYLIHQSAVAAHSLRALAQCAAQRTRQTRGISLAQAPDLTPQQEARIQRNNLGDSNWETLRHALAQLPDNKEGQKTAEALFPRVKAYLYLHPQTCATLLGQLRTAHPEKIQTALLVEALRAAGHRQAQQTLVTLTRTRHADFQMMVLLLPTLSRLESPLPAVESLLSEIAFGHGDSRITSTACLALGAMAKTLSAADPERTARLTQTLTRHLQKIHSEQEKETLLLALANASQPSTLPDVLRETTSSSKRIRSAALAALGRLPGNVVDARLCAALAHDTDARVRQVAVMGMQSHLESVAIRESLMTALAQDKDTQVRLTALNLLWNRARQLPEVVASVERTAQYDKSADIRTAASSLLAQK